jgi:glutathione synthase/RimK-type ligase-like ATP-grasp enzyme
LTGIPNLVIPRLIRFANKTEIQGQMVRHIGKAIGFPVIIRGPFKQKGIGAEKIDSPGELSRHLATLPDEELYAIEYVDNPAAQGAYRKIRAAVIGHELFITHVHFGPRWNVHRERDREKLKAFDLDGTVTAHAARIIAAPEETLGRAAMAALHEIRRRVPLEFYGIDFDILPDGRALFFEANAAMNLSLSDRAGLEATRAAMRAALRRLFLETAGLRTH